jgi:hypothetical protein
MNRHSDKTHSEPTSNPHKSSGSINVSGLIDNRPKSLAQRKMIQIANNSTKHDRQLKQLSQFENHRQGNQENSLPQSSLVNWGVSIKAIDRNESSTAECLQGLFTVSAIPQESESGIIISEIKVGERPPTENGSAQLNHAVPWNAIIVEVSGRMKGRTPEQAYDELVVLSAQKNLDISACTHPRDKSDSAMKIACLQKAIEIYLIQCNAKPEITHSDTADFTKASSSRYAPYNAEKLHEHESTGPNSILTEQEAIAIMHKVIDQTITSADPGITLDTEEWTLNAANTFARTTVYFMEGKGVIQYMDFILNMVAKGAIKKIKISGIPEKIFMGQYIEETSKLLKNAGWKID